MKKKQGIKKTDKEKNIFEEECKNDSSSEDCSTDEIIDDSTLHEQLTTRDETEGNSVAIESEDIANESSQEPSNGSGKMIVLSTVNDISDVGKLHEQWQEHLSGPIMVIEASAVERLDTSVLQLLRVLIKDADNNGIDIEWKEPSEELKYAVKVLGLKGPLKLH